MKLNPFKSAPADPTQPRPRGLAHTARLRPEGVLFVLLALLVAVAAWNTGANLLYLVFSMQLALLWLSGWLGGRNLRKLTVRWEPGQREIPAGTASRIVLLIENRKRRTPVISLAIMTQARGRLRALSKAFGVSWLIEPGQEAPVTLNIETAERGWHQIDDITLISSYPLGLIERKLHIWAPYRFLALPQPLPVRDIQTRLDGIEGDLDREQKGHGSNISGIRDYITGDPVNLIHWKHSARGLGIKAKELETEVSRRCCLVLDMRGPQKPDSAWIAAQEHAIRVTAGAAQLLLDHHFQVALWTTAGAVGPGMGRSHHMAVLRFLAELEPQGPGALPRPPEFDARHWPALQIQYADATERFSEGGPSMLHYYNGGSWRVFDARQIIQPVEMKNESGTKRSKQKSKDRKRPGQ